MDSNSNRSASRPFSGRQLEFNNPFMSVEEKKKKREKKEREREKEKEKEKEREKPYKDSLRVPFRWELTPGKPKPTSHSHTSHSHSRTCTSHEGVEEGGEVAVSSLNPARVSPLSRGHLEEAPSDMADGEDDGTFSEMATQVFLVSAVDEQHPRLSSSQLTDPDARGFIMERFLPAAQAMASDADSTTFRSPPTELITPCLSALPLLPPPLPPSVVSSVRASAHLANSVKGTHPADCISSVKGISSVDFAKCSVNGFSSTNGISSDKGIGSVNDISPVDSASSDDGISSDKGVVSDKRIGSVHGLSSVDFANSVNDISFDKCTSSDKCIGSILGISSVEFGSSVNEFEGGFVPLRFCGFLPPCIERLLCVSSRGAHLEKKKKKMKEMKAKRSHVCRPRSGRLIDMISEEDDDDWNASEDEDLVARQVRAAMRQRHVLMNHSSSPGSHSVYYDALSQPQTPLFSPFRRVTPQSPFREGKAFLGLPKTPPTCFQTPRASIDVKSPNLALQTNSPRSLLPNLAPKTNSPLSLPPNPLPKTNNPQSLPPNPPLNPPLKINSLQSLLPNPPLNPPLKFNSLQSLLPNPPLKTNNLQSLLPNPPPETKNPQSLPPNPPPKTDNPQSLPPNAPLSPPPKTNSPQSLPPNPLPKTNNPQSFLPKTNSLLSPLPNSPPKINSPQSLLPNPLPTTDSPQSLPPNLEPKTNSPKSLPPDPTPKTNRPESLPPNPVPNTDSPNSPTPQTSDASNSSGKDTSPSTGRRASRLSSGDEASTATTNEKCESWPLSITSTSSTDSPTKSPGHRHSSAEDKDSPISVLSPPLPKSPSDSWLWKAIPSIGSYPSPLYAPKMKR